MNITLAIKILIGITGYLVWAGMAYMDPTLRPDFLKFNIAMAVGTIGLVLRDMQNSAPQPAAPTTPVVQGLAMVEATLATAAAPAVQGATAPTSPAPAPAVQTIQ